MASYGIPGGFLEVSAKNREATGNLGGFKYHEQSPDDQKDDTHGAEHGHASTVVSKVAALPLHMPSRHDGTGQERTSLTNKQSSHSDVATLVTTESTTTQPEPFTFEIELSPATLVSPLSCRESIFGSGRGPDRGQQLKVPPLIGGTATTSEERRRNRVRSKSAARGESSNVRQNNKTVAVAASGADRNNRSHSKAQQSRGMYEKGGSARSRSSDLPRHSQDEEDQTRTRSRSTAQSTERPAAWLKSSTRSVSEEIRTTVAKEVREGANQKMYERGRNPSKASRGEPIQGESPVRKATRPSRARGERKREESKRAECLSPSRTRGMTKTGDDGKSRARSKSRSRRSRESPFNSMASPDSNKETITNPSRLKSRATSRKSDASGKGSKTSGSSNNSRLVRSTSPMRRLTILNLQTRKGSATPSVYGLSETESPHKVNSKEFQPSADHYRTQRRSRPVKSKSERPGNWANRDRHSDEPVSSALHRSLSTYGTARADHSREAGFYVKDIHASQADSSSRDAPRVSLTPGNATGLVTLKPKVTAEYIRQKKSSNRSLTHPSQGSTTPQSRKAPINVANRGHDPTSSFDPTRFFSYPTAAVTPKETSVLLALKASAPITKREKADATMSSVGNSVEAQVKRANDLIQRQKLKKENSRLRQKTLEELVVGSMQLPAADNADEVFSTAESIQSAPAPGSWKRFVSNTSPRKFKQRSVGSQRDVQVLRKSSANLFVDRRVGGGISEGPATENTQATDVVGESYFSTPEARPFEEAVSVGDVMSSQVKSPTLWSPLQITRWVTRKRHEIAANTPLWAVNHKRALMDDEQN
jgi:hypothetical protein